MTSTARGTRPEDQRRHRLAAAARGLAVLTIVAGVLGGCSAVEDTAQGVQDAASSKAQEAADDAKAKATQAAVDAVKSQACALVKDGSVSGAEARTLDGLASSAEAAGAPADLVALMRKVTEAGASATRGQVSDLRSTVCG